MEIEENIVEWNDRVYRFKHKPFDSEVDMDELTMIHYDNLLGEIITIPTLMNRVGILKAESDNAVRETKLSHSILEAQKGEYYRESLIKINDGKKKYPTVAQVEDAVTMDEEVSSSKRSYNKYIRQSEIIDSLYWSVKSKEMKLNRISEGITPEDFEKELLEGSINSVEIKRMKKKF